MLPQVLWYFRSSSGGAGGSSIGLSPIAARGTVVSLSVRVGSNLGLSPISARGVIVSPNMKTGWNVKPAPLTVRGLGNIAAPSIRVGTTLPLSAIGARGIIVPPYAAPVVNVNTSPIAARGVLVSPVVLSGLSIQPASMKGIGRLVTRDNILGNDGSYYRLNSSLTDSWINARAMKSNAVVYAAGKMENGITSGNATSLASFNYPDHPMSFAFWGRGTVDFLFNYNNSSLDYGIIVDASTGEVSITTGATTILAGMVDTSVFNHFAYTLDKPNIELPATGRLYVNGVKIFEGDADSAGATFNSYRIRALASGQPYTSLIDEVAIAPGIIWTDAEIQRLWNFGGGYDPTLVTNGLTVTTGQSLIVTSLVGQGTITAPIATLSTLVTLPPMLVNGRLVAPVVPTTEAGGEVSAILDAIPLVSAILDAIPITSGSFGG